MAETAAQKTTAEGSRGIGKFNIGGRTYGAKDMEFKQVGGKIKLVPNAEAVKAKQAMEKAGQDPRSTKRDGIDKSAKLTVKAEKKGSAAVLGTGDKPATLAKGKYGELQGEGTVLGVEGSVSAEASVDKDGVEVKTGAGVKVTLVGGKLTYLLPELAFSIAGERMKLVAGTSVSAEVAAMLAQVHTSAAVGTAVLQ